MKKAFAFMMALLMAAACLPLTAHASAESVLNNYFYSGIEKPQTPYIHHVYDGVSWGELYLYQDANFDIEWFGREFNRIGEEAFMENNELTYLNAYIQVDYKIDGGDWHYTTGWDTGYTDNIPNYGLHQAEQGPSVSSLSNKMLSFKISDAISYDFDDPAANGDFKGCIARSGTEPDYSHYRYDLVNHTYTYRYRYKITASDTHDGDAVRISDWSDAVSIGKNATQQNLVKPTAPAAVTIVSGSCLNEGSAEQPSNTFYLDMDIPKSIYNDLKYYEIVENAFEPLLFEVQYRVNGGQWQEGGVANAVWIETTKVFNGTDKPLKKGDKVEFRIRIAEGPDKTIVGPWSNVYAFNAVVTDYDYSDVPIDPPIVPAEPPITTLDGDASESQVTNFITGLKNDNDPKGTTYYKFPAKQSKVTKTSIKLSWNKVKGAKYYLIYGTKCGKKNHYKYIGKATANSYTYKKLKKGTYYKFLVSAFDAKGKHLATSLTIHIATKGGKVCNFKSVTTKAKKNKVTLAKKGKTFKLGAKAVKESKKLKVSVHRPMRYESTNKKIATVNSKGVITAKKKGTCYVYAFAQNGVCKKIKVTVKK